MTERAALGLPTVATECASELRNLAASLDDAATVVEQATGKRQQTYLVTARRLRAIACRLDAAEIRQHEYAYMDRVYGPIERNDHDQAG